MTSKKSDDWKIDENFNPVFTKKEALYAGTILIIGGVLMLIGYFYFFIKPLFTWIGVTITSSEIYIFATERPVLLLFMAFVMFPLFATLINMVLSDLRSDDK